MTAAWPQYMKRSTVAAFFDTSPQTIDRWVHAGVIPKPKMIGRAKRWDRDEMIAAARDSLSGAAGAKSADPDTALQEWRDARENRSQAA